MSEDNWHRAKQIFNSALDLDPAERRGYLASACNGEPALLQQVDDLLNSYESEFMEGPVVTDERTNDGRLSAGSKLGRFEILRLISVGGMGEVYLARDDKLDRHVAIKILNQKYEGNEENLQRFIREAKAASALNHPNILTIYEIGQTEDSNFIVSEFVDGKTLRRVCNERQLSLTEILDISIQISEALSTAHSARIIHRDIKPENIIVRNDGYAKVVDFGLAKLIPSQPTFVGLEDETIRQNQTAQGLIMGTVSYMSPEQARGLPVDERTDIFSLGVVIYEMLSGRTPFAANSASEAFANLINKEPAPLSQQIDLPNDLARMISKMLKKEPDERYQTMKGLLADLRKLKDRLSIELRLDRPSILESEKATDVLPGATDNVVRTAVELEQPRISSYSRLALAAAAVLLLGILTFAWYWRQPSAESQPQIKSLAVLPLNNLSGDPSQEFFADGMTEALISNLSQIKALKVISRTSIMRYKEGRESIPEIARALGVDAVIEGSVQRSGSRVRVTAQLVPATTNAPVWSRNYERQLSDILKLQSDVAQAIAGEIRVHVSADEQNRLGSKISIDPKAHEAFLLGKYHASKFNDADIARAIEYFRQATEIAPNYADAYAGLAEAFMERGVWGAGTLADYEAPMREAAMTAIRIDAENSNAHKVMAQLLNNYDRDWFGAEEEVRRALEIDPNSAEALVVYSWLLQSLGRHDEVRPRMERAEQLDPASSYIQSAFGRMLYRARNYPEAEAHLKRATELEPLNYAAYGRLVDVYVEMGRWDDAIAMAEKSQSLQPTGAHELRLAVVYARMGDRQKARDIASRARNRAAFELARLHTALGEADKAFEVLNEAIDRRDTLLVHIKEDPSFVPLHSDQRWNPLLRRLNFPE